MSAVVDRVISVPIENEDVSRTVNKLPRHPDDAEIIAVKLKRKMEYKSAHLEEFIRPKTVIKGLETLKESGNKYYQNVVIDKNFTAKESLNENHESDVEMIDEVDETCSDESDNESDTENDSEDDEEFY